MGQIADCLGNGQVEEKELVQGVSEKDFRGMSLDVGFRSSECLEGMFQWVLGFGFFIFKEN